ncbi:F-BAR domain only protein 2-like isoform X2 [Gigantopelta aegis]|uniref:F-BAR domain only protein 2-like isoform X2 n=1 Tax=Gigantopelta aegis TaxID=1735272 RepID=UPI001B88D8C1|nr:F-BAR domain only protein 2-like isoform X2 [Gigantopelta aegis]
MSTFADNFWGEKNNGFFILYQTMKHGQISSKELIEFLRESCQVEETYSKLLSKLAKNVANSSHVGTYAPFWNILKSLVEKLANLHMQLVHTWSDLIKDIVRYYEEQHKRHKAMKEEESETLNAVQSIQQTIVAVHKAKELYHTRCIELERLKRDNASQKDLEKSETKYKKARDEYKSLIDKYATVRSEFETKMTSSCCHFQEKEEEHISQMKDFIDTYARSWENQHVVLGQAYSELKRNCDELSIQKLLDAFVEAKKTGTTKPGPLVFQEPDLSNLAPQRPMSPDPLDKRDSLSDKQKQDAALFIDSSSSPSPVLSDQPGPLSRSVKLRVSRTWFLKSNKKKKEKSKKKKKEKDDKDSESIETESQDGTTPEVEVDEEGYRIRPNDPMDNNGDKNSWYSSESDSDSDMDEFRKKIKVQIRPLSPNSANATGTIEDIRASVEGLRLSPTATRKKSQSSDKKIRRSQSESDTLDKPCQDLLNLDLFAASSASTPTGAINYNIPSPMSLQTEINWNSSSPSTITSPSTSNTPHFDLFSPSPDVPDSSITGKTTPLGSSFISSPPTVPGPSTSIARPPSRNKGIIPQLSKQASQGSPVAPVSRSESGCSVTFNTTSMPIGSSRGPSPLTIGMSDNIPLAVAFTETVNAYFKGHDATKSMSEEDVGSRCVVRIAGNVMMSFPAGVVKVFTENPSPAMLSFRIKNISKLENITPNSELIVQDASESSSFQHVYTFHMSALVDHLRQQGEQNKSASYFNVDILKYQVKTYPGVESTPLPLVVYWKCDETNTDYRLDYRYNSSSMSTLSTLKNVTVAVNITGGVTKMQSIPSGQWSEEHNRATWKLNDISEVSEEATQGCIRAKFELKSGPSIPSTTALQFASDGSTISGVEFELVGSGYRISLAKKRFASGKYYVDPEPDLKYV